MHSFHALAVFIERKFTENFSQIKSIKFTLTSIKIENYNEWFVGEI